MDEILGPARSIANDIKSMFVAVKQWSVALRRWWRVQKESADVKDGGNDDVENVEDAGENV